MSEEMLRACAEHLISDRVLHIPSDEVHSASWFSEQESR